MIGTVYFILECQEQFERGRVRSDDAIVSVLRRCYIAAAMLCLMTTLRLKIRKHLM
jgi:hypothetical protein